jgi:UrcA family protein
MTMLKPAIAALAALLLVPAAGAEERAPKAGFAFDIQITAQDVATADNAMKLLNRLERRVRAKCGYGDLRRSVAGSISQRREDMKTCVETTMRATVDSLHHPMLVQAYDMRRG